MAIAESLDGTTLAKGDLIATVVRPRLVGRDLVLELVVRRGGQVVTPPHLNPITFRDPSGRNTATREQLLGHIRELAW